MKSPKLLISISIACLFFMGYSSCKIRRLPYAHTWCNPLLNNLKGVTSYDRYNTIFIGKILKKKHYRRYVHLEILVSHCWKGSMPHKITLNFHHDLYRSSFSKYLSKGKYYFMIGNKTKHPNKISTSFCYPSVKIDNFPEASDLFHVGKEDFENNSPHIQFDEKT